MQLAQLLGQVPGLDKRLVSYLEAVGYIQPVRVRKTRIARRDYSEHDLRRVQRLWSYYRRGYSLQRARELAEQPAPGRVYVFLKAPGPQRQRALQLLPRLPQVRAGTAVYAGEADLVLELDLLEEADIWAVITRLLEEAAMAGAPQLLRTEPPVPGHFPPRQCEMLAYVLIKVPAKQLDAVLDQLRTFTGVAEAAVVYGETDLIAKLAVSNQTELDELVVRKIQALPLVESTRTYIAIGGMHWQRPPADLPSGSGAT